MADIDERIFHDERYPDKLISEAQLKREYGQLVLNGDIDPAEESYPQHIHNCMSSQGGTLTEMLPEKEKLATFKFMVRETLTQTIEVEAKSFEAAQDAVQRLYDDDEINLDHNCFAGVEFRPLCAKCESDFDDDADCLREVNGGTPLAMMLCDRCVEDMADLEELTCCASCGDVFSSSRLLINPANSEQEICPECGEVWCD